MSATTQNAILDGRYAFMLGGHDSGLAGSIVADGQGNITGGSEDVEDPAHSLSGANVAIASGAYTVGSDGRGVLSYTDANGNTFAFDLVLGTAPTGVATKGTMIETDPTGNTRTGSLALQLPSSFTSSALVGGYAFGFSGWDGSSFADVVVGRATISGGSVSDGMLDENDGGTLTSSQSFTGSLSVNSTGRGTLTSGTAQANFTFYVISSSQWFAIASDASTGAVRTGDVELQSNGPYAATSLNGTMVLQSQTATSAPAPQATVGLVTSVGGGTADYSFDVDAAGTLGTQTGTYTVDFGSGSNGRFTLTPQGANPLVGYMIARDKAFVAGTDSAPSFGTFEQQSTGPFGNASLNGSFLLGTLPLVSAPSTAQAPIFSSGIVSFDGAGGISGTIGSIQGGTLTTSQLAERYAVGPNGRVTFAPTGEILYIVSPTRVVVLYAGPSGFPNPFIEIVQK